MEILKFSNALNVIVPEGLALERLATGFKFTEGPVWDARKGCLFFSDIPSNTIHQWSPGQDVGVFREPTGNSNGLTVDHEGHLLACEHTSRRVSRTDSNGEAVSIALQYEGKRLNSPNDIVVKSDGSLYFTDPPYGLSSLEEMELSFQGVYRLETSTGALTLLVDDFDRPNGLAFSPDEKVLYIDDSARQHVRAFDVKADGTLENGRVFAQLDPSVGSGVPDGLKVDVQGNVYVTGPGGIWVISPNGEILGVLKVPEVTANVGWGEDGRSLFITASTSLYRLRLNISGKIPGQL